MMKQISDFSGLHASPARENFAPDPPTSAPEFLRQNANILADAYFRSQIDGFRQKLAERQTLRDQVEEQLVAYIDGKLSTAPLQEEADPLLDSYLVVRNILDDILCLLEGVIALCLWLARQYTQRLQMDITAYCQLHHLRVKCQQLEAKNAELAEVIGRLQAENQQLTQRAETGEEALLTLANRILVP